MCGLDALARGLGQLERPVDCWTFVVQLSGESYAGGHRVRLDQPDRKILGTLRRAMETEINTLV